MNIKGFELGNEEKLNRVIFGSLSREGKLEGGLGEGADEALILAYYDRLGGFITKDGNKVVTGSFWDTKTNKPFAKPNVKYIFRVNGAWVELNAEEPLPLEVQASKEAAKKSKKVKK